MAIHRDWVVRNLGLKDETKVAALTPEMTASPHDDRAFVRDLLRFDSEGPEGATFAEQATASTGLSKFVDIPWPAGLAPEPGPRPAGAPTDALPECDVLIVTWTVDEGHALSRVLTPGFDSRNDWAPYTKNYDMITAHMPAEAPAKLEHRLGTYWTATINGQTVTLFKSESLLSQDGAHLPVANEVLLQQMIADCKPKLVITTGTGGGIGPSEKVGDVIVSRYVTFDCQRDFKNALSGEYSCATAVSTSHFATAKTLFHSNAQFLPPDDHGVEPKIIEAKGFTTGVLTTDFYGWDDTKDTFGLQGNGSISEMGDAILGKVCAELGDAAPDYVCIRNVSDPQIDSSGETVSEEEVIAGKIYRTYGRWSSVCSAIVCWAIVAAR